LAKKSPRQLAARGLQQEGHSSKSSAAVVLDVHRDNLGNLSVKFDSNTLRGAERTFSASCAFPRKRHGLFDIVFVQLDPFRDDLIARAVVVRYSIQRAVERVVANEEFRSQLETVLVDPTGRRDVGYFTRLGEAAKPPNDGLGWSACIDAEMDVMVFTGERATIVFFEASVADLSLLARGATQLAFTPQLEVTLSSQALADLLQMWKDVTPP
jgi:hypothetical protein